MTGARRSTIACGGNQRRNRASSRGSRFFGPVNSSAHSPSSDASTSISPSGVDTTALYRRIAVELSTPKAQLSTLKVSLEICELRGDQMSHDRLLLLDQLLDAVVREIEQRVQGIAPERH